MGKDDFPAHNREVFATLLGRCDTVISSSAVVTRVFSVGSDVYNLRYSILTSMNLDIFVLMKGSSYLLQLEILEEEEGIPCLERTE